MLFDFFHGKSIYISIDVSNTVHVKYWQKAKYWEYKDRGRGVDSEEELVQGNNKMFEFRIFVIKPLAKQKGTDNVGHRCI